MEILRALRTQQEGLRADVRVEAERKMKALEADLAAGERANNERALATRYHKVKFFGASCTLYHRPLDVLKTRDNRSPEASAQDQADEKAIRG